MSTTSLRAGVVQGPTARGLQLATIEPRRRLADTRVFYGSG
jgi:hypothetical protein